MSLLRQAAIALGIVVALWAIPASAGAKVVWLCRPGVSPDPCAGDQTTTYYAADGSSTTAPVPVPADPPIDCFYVYPTVSNEPATTADQRVGPEERSIAIYQAQRFSTRCRVFAPMYRQRTIAGLELGGVTHSTAGLTTAFGDVEEAWRAYLRDYNHGRGVVLLGHSQGSTMLRVLLHRDIDPDPAVRSLLVSAIIPGANASVARGRDVGGDFGHIPACRSGAQTGCVIAYSSFDQPPPSNSRFGTVAASSANNQAFGLPTGPGLEVICTDPAKLAGVAGGALQTLVPSAPFAPGFIALAIDLMYGGPPPSAPTPWFQPRDHYTGRCETSNGANVLMVTPIAGARTLHASPDATWGLHLLDVNLPLGELTTIVGMQTGAYLGARRPLAARLSLAGAAGRPQTLSVAVTGRPGARVAVTLVRDGRAVARRDIVLHRGRATARFTAARPGRYRAVARDRSVGTAARTRAVTIG
jgi:hypothetical protein